MRLLSPSLSLSLSLSRARLRRYPCDCTSEAFDPSALNATTLREMAVYWPTLSTGGDDAFWSHEWSKHGTCALDVLPSQADYFAGALKPWLKSLRSHPCKPKASKPQPCATAATTGRRATICAMRVCRPAAS